MISHSIFIFIVQWKITTDENAVDDTYEGNKLAVRILNKSTKITR
jgi:hypothetical protein